MKKIYNNEFEQRNHYLENMVDTIRWDHYEWLKNFSPDAATGLICAEAVYKVAEDEFSRAWAIVEDEATPKEARREAEEALGRAKAALEASCGMLKSLSKLRDNFFIASENLRKAMDSIANARYASKEIYDLHKASIEALEAFRATQKGEKMSDDLEKVSHSILERDRMMKGNRSGRQ